MRALFGARNPPPSGVMPFSLSPSIPASLLIRYYSAQSHRDASAESLARLGKIDNAALRVLGENGVRLNTFGTIADTNKYQNLMLQGFNVE